MKLEFTPNENTFALAKRYITLLDSDISPIKKDTEDANPAIISKLAKKIKTIQAPVPRYFENPAQINSTYSEAEYDLNSIFKLMKYEAYFMKSVQKKLSLLVKSGFFWHSDNDNMKKYLNNRFTMMSLQTGISLKGIITQLAMYLIICSNAFIIKVRDKDFTFGESYFKDGKEMHPVVGLFTVHPTSMRPKWKTVKHGKTFKMVIDKWLHVNARGMTTEFSPEDVVHFTLYKEDGMVFGCPEVIPVIDDIRTFRKIEEDVQLLIYRDLFPIIHYSIENPRMLDHKQGISEIDKARIDMERIVQDGGIVTDGRHEIDFVGNQGKGMDADPYLKHFQARVFTGLGVSPSDMGLGQDISGNTANSMSKQLLDTVRYVQQELARQFNENILTEIILQSPYAIESLSDDTQTELQFVEIDIEWRIRKENHEVDLYTKDAITIDEVRTTLGRKNLPDENLSRLHTSLITEIQTAHETEAQDHLARLQAGLQPETVQTSKTATGGSSKKVSKPATAPPSKPNNPMKTSSADRDSIKSAKSNSNITKSLRDAIKLVDSIDTISIQDQFKNQVLSIKDVDKSQRKLKILVATKVTYDTISDHMIDKFKEGVIAANAELGVNYEYEIEHKIFDGVSTLRDNVARLIEKDDTGVNRAAARVAAAYRTEGSRAYNYGYALACVNNNRNEFTICSDSEVVSEDSLELIGKEISVNKTDILTKIPPFRTNSKLKLKVKEKNNG